MERIDHYEVLGITSNASSRDITYAYRKLALEYHPDRNKTPHANDMMSKINTAYDILSDPNKRKEYDFNKRNGKGVYYEHYVSQNNNNRSNQKDSFDPNSKIIVKTIIIISLILKVVVIELRKLLHRFFN